MVWVMEALHMTQSNQDLRDLNPAEIDQILADTEYAAMKVASPLTSLKAAIREAYRSSQKAWNARQKDSALARMADLEAKVPAVEATVTELLKPFHAEIAKIDAEFSRRDGWNRYFLVVSSIGHVHIDRSCSSCHAGRTEFAWLPGASGQDGAGLIAMFGAKVCSICFPEAPIEELLAAEKAAKAAAAKADGYCDGHGKYANDNGGFVYCSPRGECPDCKRTVSVTSTGKCRKHKGSA